MWETLPDAMVEGQAEEVSACERAECAIDDDAELEDQGEDEDVEVGRGEDDEDEGGEEDEEDPAGGEARRAPDQPNSQPFSQSVSLSANQSAFQWSVGSLSMVGRSGKDSNAYNYSADAGCRIGTPDLSSRTCRAPPARP